MPRIWVWTAPVAPIVQRSLLFPALNWGAIAEGGGDLTVVVCEPLVVTVDVDSVTIGSAAWAGAGNKKLSSTAIKPPNRSDTNKKYRRAAGVIATSQLASLAAAE